MSHKVLGIDIGTNSLGWSLLDDEEGRILATGVRVFPEGVDRTQTGGEVSKNETRRTARGTRRQTRRRRERKETVRNALIEAGLFPKDPEQQTQLLEQNPYDLRQKGLTEKLTLQEFGRILYALSQRRGYKSNSKTDRKDQKATDGLLAEINQLQSEIEENHHKTLGEHFASELQSGNPIRGRHTLRAMYLEEFEQLWNAQAKHHPKKLTAKLKQRLNNPVETETWVHKGLIFGQRKMYWKKSTIGKCELEMKEVRCEKMDRLAQQFRLYQEVNNLRLIESGTERRLSPEERETLLEYLSTGKERTFDQIRKKLKLYQSAKFNLEEGDRSKLLGMPVDARLAHKNIFTKKWYQRPEQEKTEIVRFILDHDDTPDLIEEKALNEWGLDEEATAALLKIDLTEGRVNYSRKAIEKLLPFIIQGLPLTGKDDTENALHKAGYLRADQRSKSKTKRLPVPPDIPNPIVKQALHEVRKLVNTLIDEYGIPDAIHIEMARSVSGSADQRLQMSLKMRERERERDAAADYLRQEGFQVSRNNIDRYLLWKEQGEHCAYCDKNFSPPTMFNANSEIEVDHILPRSRSLDNSWMNKVVCCRDCNSAKGNQTPFEWLFKVSQKRYDKVLQGAARLPYLKRQRFSQPTLELNDFLERNLVDTGYIASEVRKYMSRLDTDVICTKGQLTSLYRRYWELNNILHDDGLNIKNRDDHRHHAIDAIIVALMNRSNLQKLSGFWKAARQAHLNQPWKNFRSEIEAAVNSIHVSHRTRRKISGALHEETIFGATKESATTYVRRKPISSINNTSQVEKVRDPQIKQIIKEYLQQHGVDIEKKSLKINEKIWADGVIMPSGVPVKKVRMLEESTGMLQIRPNQFTAPGSNHHIEIYELLDESGEPILNKDGSPKREGTIVTMFEAAQRAKNKQPLINRNHGSKTRFVMSLGINEMILLDVGQADPVLHRVQKLSLGRIILRPHTYAGQVNNSDKPPLVQRKSPNTLRGQKVTIDFLGRVRWAND
ncbi:type II CRISPR RNA-guided endonuclease Cas9 [uncultured Gimesia sp.]|uniref:type II CRISPR RNA-guided endonuclease Cas9 n=1 Tax=uncultured Gimesia sp. TaxID=1678688 RepID=UPI0030D700C8|tara:strand:+ start:1072 stop:4089 length:3018 start_codon:yes stop_codon:yes gene_type:complete